MRRAERQNLCEMKPGNDGLGGCVTLHKTEQKGLGGSGWL